VNKWMNKGFANGCFGIWVWIQSRLRPEMCRISSSAQ